MPIVAALLVSLLPPSTPPQDTGTSPFEPGARVVLVGNALAERMQHHGWLETELQTRLPELGLTVRNLGFSADELTVHQRTEGFGTQAEWLARCEADVVLAFYGFVESFAGPEGVEDFATDLARFVDDVRAESRALVLFTPVSFEDVGNPYLPPVRGENERIRPYAEAIERVAREKDVRCVDLFTAMEEEYKRQREPLTINGVHLNERGNAALANVVADALCGEREAESDRREAVRALVLEKNDLWFNRYRATDGYNVYGGRSTLEYDGVTNAVVLQRELEVLDALCAELDRRIHAVARGADDPGPRDEPPAQIPVATNRPGDGPEGAHEFLAGEDALARMTLAEGCVANLYASEERFPRLVNPVQMSWDPKGRLWVAVWPTYPHWRPGTERNDALLILTDDDGDGVADRSQVFADGLHNPTGFEHWDGGVFVANAPDILFLKDTDGDDVADERARVLHGLSSADTHHSANSFVLGPDGGLYFQEGIFHQSQIETIHGPMRSRDACVWRFDPRSWRVERYIPYGFLNPHGHVFDRWGQDFVTDGTGNVNYFALPMTGFLEQPDKHPATAPFFEQRSRPAAGTEILSSAHFPDEFQQNYLIANVIGFQGVFRYALEDDGSGFSAKELDPLLQSSDPRFRPSDLEVGPDGAVYVLDWHNPLIGHMQHHLRDPSRDKAHGRVYRVTYAGRPLSEPEDLTRLSVRELVARLRSPEDRVRYRTRIELSGRPSEEVRDATRYAGAGDPMPDEHYALEAFWVNRQHGDTGDAMLKRLLDADEPRVRAAAVRALQWEPAGSDAVLPGLEGALFEGYPRARLAAVVGLSRFAGTRWGASSAGRAVNVLRKPTDRFLDYAVEETVRALEPDWKPALLAGELGGEYLVRRLSDDELRAAYPTRATLRESLRRPAFGADEHVRAAEALADTYGTSVCEELLDAIRQADTSAGAHAEHLVAGLFDALAEAREEVYPSDLARLAADARHATTRRRATAMLMREPARVATLWESAAERPGGLLDLLDAAPAVREAESRAQLLDRALDVARREPAGSVAPTRGRYVRVELPGAQRTLTLAEVEVFSNGTNVAPGGTATQSSVNWGGVPERALDGNASGAFGDGGQTHTVEDMPDPWWELDLGREVPVEEIVLHNRTEGDFGRRLDGCVVRVLDGDRRQVFVDVGGEAPARIEIELADPALRTRRAAIAALAALGWASDAPPERVETVARELVLRFDDPNLRASVVRAARSTPIERWPAREREELARALADALEGAADGDLVLADREALALAAELAPHVDEELSARLRATTARGPLVLVLRPVRDRMLYDRTELVVPAGHAVELVFENVDIMPHNVVLAAPGALATVGRAAEAMASAPDAWERGYVPDLDEVLVASRLLQPGERQTLRFDAPAEPGDYPYVCTFPGHWVRMNGVLHVVEPDAVLPDAAVVDAGADATDATNAPGRAFVRDWDVGDFRRELRKLDDGADPERGRRVFEEASCIRCHRVADGPEGGGITGPDMREIARKNGLSEILTQVFEPSRRIAEGYATEIFVTTDGLIHAGRVLEETADHVLVQDDPYRADGVELPKSDIEERNVSDVSAMPKGLLSTFEKDEILDLVAFVRSLKDEER